MKSDFVKSVRQPSAHFEQSGVSAGLTKGLTTRRLLNCAVSVLFCAGLLCLMSAAAFADGGTGGADGANQGGAGGSGYTGASGQAGSPTAGAGGGAAGGGAGGTSAGGTGAAGGAGGTSGSPNGGNGQNNSSIDGGGGGGGGYNGNGNGAATISNAAPLSGGSGGNGGDATNGGAGGGGGGGGYGAIITGSAQNTNTGTISGGNGGAGGNVTNCCFPVAGNGGDGGVGVQFSTGNATLTNSGTISGGNGGAGGVGTANHNGLNGAGGAGIVGANITIINSGTISGGLAGDGTTRANAVTFTGGTNVFEFQAGSTVTGNIVAFSAADTLRLGGATNASFDVSQIGSGSSPYQGFGVFAKFGTSTWTLSGTNTAVQPWSINAGTLAVNGTMANSTMTVNNGGTLSGTGTIGSATVNTGGTFAPGSGTPGTSMSLAGNLLFQSGAIYMVQLNPTTSSSATITGAATLGGATVSASFANGSFISKQYTILTAGNISGTFNPTVTNTNLPSNFSDTLSYDPTHAYLDLTLNFSAPTGPTSGLTGNQQAVANTLVNFFNKTGGIPMAFGALTGPGLTQASGETSTGSQQTTFGAMEQFMGIMTDPFMNRGGGGGGYSSPSSGYAEENAYPPRSNPTDAFAMFNKAPIAQAYEPRWSVWVGGYGGSQSTTGDTVMGSNNTTSSIAASAVGADYLISPSTIAGFAMSGGGSRFSVANGGSGRSDLFQFGGYVRHNAGPAYITAALAYGWQDITTNRTVTAAGFDQLRAEFNANSWSGRIEGGYRFVSPATFGVGITPYAAAKFVTLDLPSYSEQAVVGNMFGLAYGAKDVTDPRTELGFRTDKSWAVDDGLLTLRSRFAWSHDFDPNRSVAATFQSLPGASFVVNGATQGANSALTTASLEMKWRNGWSIAGTFEGEFSNVTNSYAGTGALRYTW